MNGANLQWRKTRKEYENKGMGRGLLSVIMDELLQSDYPIYLHTQPDSFRAINLYTDFGVCFLDNKQIGKRKNIIIVAAPKEFLQTVERFERAEF